MVLATHPIPPSSTILTVCLPESGVRVSNRANESWRRVVGTVGHELGEGEADVGLDLGVFGVHAQHGDQRPHRLFVSEDLVCTPIGQINPKTFVIG